MEAMRTARILGGRARDFNGMGRPLFGRGASGGAARHVSTVAPFVPRISPGGACSEGFPILAVGALRR
jgi:hypothetical protein